MAEGEPSSVTKLLRDVGRGNKGTLERIWSRVQDEVPAIAQGKLAREQDPQAMESTVLVHETFIRCLGKDPVDFKNRKNFSCYAAKVMAHLLIDDARARRHHLSIEQASAAFGMPAGKMRDLTECLERLERVRPRGADVVRLRFFARRTVDGDWDFARAWLHRCLKKGDTTLGVEANAHDN